MQVAGTPLLDFKLPTQKSGENPSQFYDSLEKIKEIFGGKAKFDAIPTLDLGKASIDRMTPNSAEWDLMTATTMKGKDCQGKIFIVFKHHDLARKIKSYAYIIGNPTDDSWYRNCATYFMKDRRMSVSCLRIGNHCFDFIKSWVK